MTLRLSRFRPWRRVSLASACVGGLIVVTVGNAWAASVIALDGHPTDSVSESAPVVEPSPWAIAIYPPSDLPTAEPSASATVTEPTAAPFTVYAPPAPTPSPVYPPSDPAASRTIRFDGPAGRTPSAADWNYDIGGNGWGNGELQTYTSTSSNSYLDGQGHLVVTARRETVTGPDGIARNYTSARLTTANKVVIQPGSYVEASITAPVGAGLLTAFGTVGTNLGQVGWQRAGALDILGGDGATPTLAHSALHMASRTNPNVDNVWGWGRPGGTTDLGSSLDAGPHLYGVYFDANVVRFYVDRKLTMQFTAAQAAASDRSWPFGASQFLVLDVALDARAPGTTLLPRSLTVGPINVFSKLPF